MHYLLLLLACTADPVDSGDTASELVNPGILSRDDGWLRGDLHMHSTWSDGLEDVATLIRLGEYLDDPVFLDFHPEYRGNGLDFIAITDHRTVAAHSDPDHHSDRLVLVRGEEFGGPGHAGLFGVHTHVDHGSDVEAYRAAVEATHAQGALFSPNHPFLPDIPFPWDVRTHDAIEVVNAGWALMSPDTTPERLASWEASRGPASPLYRRAVQVQGQGSSMQSLAWYEAQLSRGVHVALVGGSDRHLVLLPGFPTTWIRAGQVSEAGLLDGIRARHTMVSRTPASAQVALEVEGDGSTWQMGDAPPIPAGGAEVVVRVHVGRADGGRVRLVRGEAVATDEDLEGAPLGAVVQEWEVVGEDFETELTLSVVPGTWLYPMVVEPLIPDHLTAQRAAEIRQLAVEAVEMGEEDFAGLVTAAAGFLDDPEVLSDASRCDPSDWQADSFQCATADTEGMASLYVPDDIDRAFNVLSEDGVPTEWVFGALGSAVLFVEEAHRRQHPPVDRGATPR